MAWPMPKLNAQKDTIVVMQYSRWSEIMNFNMKVLYFEHKIFAIYTLHTYIVETEASGDARKVKTGEYKLQKGTEWKREQSNSGN